ncbi:MAG: hypothetical protein ACI9FB_001410 [Candidatus Azotimanducaceae bacterium]|jgi:hypothetical protein
MAPYSLLRSAGKMLIVTLALTSASIRADLVSDTESGKKTMSKFMVNLAKFVTWPDGAFPDPAAPYKYCIFGNPVMGSFLDAAMDGKVTKNRPFEISRIDASEQDDLKSCNVAFISMTSNEEVASVVDVLNGLPILTVGEIEDFAGYGGMIGFYGKGRKVALAINKKRLESGGLKGSSKLFKASTM